MAAEEGVRMCACKVTIKKTAENIQSSSLVGLPGLEPGKAGPESAVLPLHHSPIVFGCEGTAFFLSDKHFCGFCGIFCYFFRKIG